MALVAVAMIALVGGVLQVSPAAADAPCVRQVRFTTHSGNDGLRRSSAVRPFVMALNRTTGIVERHFFTFPDGRDRFNPAGNDQSQEWFGATGRLSRCLDNVNVGAIGVQAILDPGDGWFSWADQWDLLEFRASDPVSRRPYVQHGSGRLLHHFTTTSSEFASIPSFHGLDRPTFNESYLFGCHPSLGVRYDPAPRNRIEVIAWSFSPTNPTAMRARIVPFDAAFDDFFVSATSLGITNSQTPIYFSGHFIDSSLRHVHWGRVKDCQLKAFDNFGAFV